LTTGKLSGAVDFAYLEGFAAGDQAIVDEVLALFREQAVGWAAQLVPPPPGWRDVVHTIKGTSRGVGAFPLGEACAVAERNGEGALAGVVTALRAAVEDITAYQATAR
jgi:hypothetical protein